MAESSTQRENSFTCSVCLDLIKDPVAVPCGHTYCLGCIKGCWDQEDGKGIYSCPQCRQTLRPRPVLSRNILIAEMVEEFRKTRIQTDVPAHCTAGPGDVECDVCTGRKLKAVKSCLDCLLSYCETHFGVHNDVNPGRKHSVIDATGQLQERICSHHKKVFEIFCRTDQSCICYLCTMDEHKGHDTVTAAAERTDKQVSTGATCVSNISMRALLRTNCESILIVIVLKSHQSLSLAVSAMTLLVRERKNQEMIIRCNIQC